MTALTTRARRLTGRVLVGLVAGGLAVPLVNPSAANATATCGEVTPAAVAAYFDGAVPGALAQHNVPGTVVSVVSGGETVFAQGYGLSDVEHHTAFSASDSLVRIASITKLFTATAVMQQVEAGRLDLNADVNRYLTGFQIPDRFDRPITLLDLMNHTAGFENYIIGTGALAAEDVPALGDYLAAHVPARIYPPGEISAYSNYGAALAGYIVAEVSGEPYDVYVQRHILDPLNMRHSTATEPVPPALAGDLAHSYNSDTTPPTLVPFEFDNLTPDGSISASAGDLAHFMVAHLHDGQYGDARILAPATVSLMHERTFAADPRLDGWAHGFQDKVINGHRVLLHDGSWEAFLSILILVPDCDLGLFISTNGTNGVETATQLMDGFFDQFAPEQEMSTSDTGSARRTTPTAGFYMTTRHNDSGVEKIVNLLGPARLTLDNDGTVHFGGHAWTAGANGLYSQVDGANRLVFLTGTDGRRYVATNGPSYELMEPAETLPFNLVVLLIFAVPALAALAMPLMALLRRLRRRPATTTPIWRLARALGAGSALTGLVFVILMFLVVAGDTSEYLYGAPASFLALLALPIVALAAALASTGLTVRSWRGSAAGIVARVHQVTLLLGMAALAWFVWQWNLIGWQL